MCLLYVTMCVCELNDIENDDSHVFALTEYWYHDIYHCCPRHRRRRCRCRHRFRKEQYELMHMNSSNTHAIVVLT